MVKRIQAWAAEDGKVFESEIEALRHDAMCILRKTNLFTEGTILGMVQDPHKVVDALQPICELMPRSVIAALVDTLTKDTTNAQHG